ncbi:MAG TPA: nuclear transport factor 2 family protein [Steroidobacteraceae bacterium]|nr:nuclear transport factor 2 family protein [Steroidobacteraceae bacterium]
MDTATARPFQPDRDGWLRLFHTIDARDATGFVEYLTPDAQFRFGNAPAVAGRDAIRGAVAAFFDTIAGSHHELLGTWAGDSSAVCEGRVTYTRHDGTAVGVPFVNVFELRGARISQYRIYIDLSPLFGAH